MLWTVGLLGCYTLAHAQTWREDEVKGVLEKTATHAAIMTSSPESGDLVGHVFAHDSVVGRAVAKSCQPSQVCELRVVELAHMSHTEANALGFKDHPSAWLLVTSAKSVQRGR